MKDSNFPTATDRGVVPALGVILLVAITVILVAATAPFVMGFGEKINDPQPMAVLELEFDEVDVDPNNDDGDYEDIKWEVDLVHSGGETLTQADITVHLDHGSERITGTFDGTLSPGETVEMIALHTDGGTDYDCNQGNVACILADHPENYPNQDYIELRMIDNDAGTVIYDEEIDISGKQGLFDDEDHTKTRTNDTLVFK